MQRIPSRARAVAHTKAGYIRADLPCHFHFSIAKWRRTIHSPTASQMTEQARVSGTVIIAFETTKDGKVRRAMTVSGPKLQQAPVLAAVRQWTFKPYPLHGEPATVATTFQFNKPIAFRNRMEQVSRSGICCSRRFKLKSSETHSKAHLTLRKSEAGRIC